MSRKLLLTPLLTALLALVLPALSVPAQAAPAAGLSERTSAVAPAQARGRTSLELARSAPYSHVGQKGVKLTARVTAAGKPGTGKVVFKLGKKTLEKAKLKKGKASIRLPRGLKPGKYVVTAKYKKVTKKTKVRVYDSAVRLSGVAFTVSKSASRFDHPEVTGTVKFRGKTAKTGYVDMYQGGRVKEGSSSKWYCCFATVSDDGSGSFAFSSYSFLGKVAEEKDPGTYEYQAFYTPTASYDEYIYSSVIKVTVTE